MSLIRDIQKGSQRKQRQNKTVCYRITVEINRVVFHKKILHKLIPKDNDIDGGSLPFTNADEKIT